LKVSLGSVDWDKNRQAGAEKESVMFGVRGDCQTGLSYWCAGEPALFHSAARNCLTLPLFNVRPRRPGIAPAARPRGHGPGSPPGGRSGAATALTSRSRPRACSGGHRVLLLRKVEEAGFGIFVNVLSNILQTISAWCGSFVSTDGERDGFPVGHDP
jgi:hypothetical protein